MCRIPCVDVQYDVNRRAMSKRVVYTVLNLHSDKNETKKSAKMDRYLKCEFLPIPNTVHYSHLEYFFVQLVS